jgi:CHAT domain-containing protein
MTNASWLQPLAVALVIVVNGAPPSSEPSTLDLAQRAYHHGAFREARRLCELSISLAARSQQPHAELAATRMLARVLDRTADPAAQIARDRARALARSLSDRATLARLSLDESMYSWRAADYGPSVGSARAASEIADSLHEASLQAETLAMVSRIDFKVGKYDAARAGFERAIELERALGEFAKAAQLQIELGAVHLEQRQYLRAIETFTAAQRLARQGFDSVTEIRAEEQIAITWMFQGAPWVAQSILEPLLHTSQRLGFTALAGHVEYLLGNALRQGGFHHRAIESYQRAATTLTQHGDDREVAWVLSRLSRAQAELGRYAEAEQALDSARASWERLGDARAAAYALYDLGRLHRLQHRDESARASWRRAIAAQTELALPYLALPLSDLALLELENDPSLATIYATDAVRAADRSANPEMAWVARYRHGMIERALGRSEAALESFDEALAIVESLEPQISPSEEAWIGVGEAHQALFSETATLLIDLGRLGEALARCEQGRRHALERRREEHVTPLPRNVGTVLEYVVGERTSAVLVLDSSQALSAARLNFDGEALSQQVSALRLGLESAADTTRELRWLYAQLIAPIRARLPADPGSVLVIVPHGELHLVPFAALLDEQDQHLVERYTISYLPALQSIAARSDWSLEPRVLLIADASRSQPPLAGARREAEAIAHQFRPEESTLLVGESATESRVRALLDDATLVHFATHALIDPRSGAQSRLFLTEPAEPTPLDDGRLTAQEIAGLRLRARLVTLAACRSAEGRLTSAGTVGLSRSFLIAGAESVVSSLWRLADAPTQLQMTRFYRELLASQGDAAHSLREAQRATLAALRKGELHDESNAPFPPSPTYWAALIHVGAL